MRRNFKMMRMNYYNKYCHRTLGQYYLFHKVKTDRSFRKYPLLKQKRSTRLLLRKKNQLRRFVYSNVKPKRDKRRL